MSKLLWIFIGGGAGAGLRYLIASSEWLRMEGGFPLGTFFVNLLGCFLIGLIWQYAQNSNILSPLLIIGFLGGFTTFSSFGLESYNLFTDANYKALTSYVLLSNILGIALVYLGYYLSSLFQMNQV
jgi:fluoride exporter